MAAISRFCVAVGRACDRAAVAVLVGLVAAYKVAISPWLGRHCRYEPTCSAYFRQAVEKHGAIRGTIKGLLRICRCHPWHPGGYDPP
jgi:putative membrane protein insertion efficiency factor